MDIPESHEERPEQDQVHNQVQEQRNHTNWVVSGLLRRLSEHDDVERSLQKLANPEPKRMEENEERDPRFEVGLAPFEGQTGYPHREVNQSAESEHETEPEEPTLRRSHLYYL